MAKLILLVMMMLTLPVMAQQAAPVTTSFFDVPPGGILASLVTGLLSALGAWRLSIRQRVRVSPDPLNVRGVSPSIKEPLCEQKHKSVDERLRENREDHSNIFPRLTDLEKRMGILEGTIKEIKEEYHSIDDKLTILLRRK